MKLNYKELLTVTFTLFAIIDIIGSIPILISIKNKIGAISNFRVTIISGALMLLFLFMGETLLNILGLGVSSFAVGGSIVIFILGLEMVLGVEFIKTDDNPKSTTLVPLAFPLIAGSGTLTTIMSLKANYNTLTITLGILINLAIIYIVMSSIDKISQLIGEGGLIAIRKFFGVILLAIAVKMFATNAPGLLNH
jgi:multiple antibiotic resistance protein